MEFVSLGDTTVVWRSDTEVELAWDTSLMGLTTNELRVGLAAGTCDTDDYWCDHFPDGWGDPYVSFSSAEWFSMEW